MISLLLSLIVCAMPSVHAGAVNTYANGDFSNKTFSGFDFKGKDLSGANFTNCTFNTCDFSGANCTHGIFDGARFYGVTAACTDFSFASMKGVHLDDASNFSYSNFYSVDFSAYQASETFLNAAFTCAIFELNKTTRSDLELQLSTLQLTEDGIQQCAIQNKTGYHYPPMKLNFTPVSSGDMALWYSLSDGDWEHVYRAHPYYRYALASGNQAINHKVIASCGVLQLLDLGNNIQEQLLSNCFHNAINELTPNEYKTDGCTLSSLTNITANHQAQADNPLDALYQAQNITHNGVQYTFKSLVDAVQHGSVVLTESDIDTICSHCSASYDADKESATNPCSWARGRMFRFRFKKPIYNCINTCRAALKKVKPPIRVQKLPAGNQPVLQFSLNNQSPMPYRW
jgi:hypothetical protein